MQTLTILPAITLPVTPAQAATLSSNITAIANLNNQQTLALSVLSKIYKLKVVHAEVDYSANFTQLQTDAESLMGVFSIIDGVPSGSYFLMRVQAIMDWNAGYTALNTLGSNVATLVTKIGQLSDLPESTLWKLYMFLLYRLAV
jgi:hypothetical protein